MPNDLTKEQFLEIAALWAGHNETTWTFTKVKNGQSIASLSETDLVTQFRRFDPTLADMAQKILDVRLEMAAHIRKSLG